jgi:hypothetical protein
MSPVLNPEGELTRMVTRTKTIVSGLLFLVLFFAGPVLGQTWQVGAGLSQADVGLDGNGMGLTLSVGRSLVFHDEWLDFSFAGEYVQKAGVQPRMFTSAETPLFRDDEKIRLHYLQPSMSLGVRRPGTSVVPRIYAGASMGLKVHEGWTRPVEDGQELLSYEDTDFQVHLGASLQFNHVGLDFRYCAGLVSQLVVEPINFPSLLKADDPLPDVDDAEDGAKISSWQAAATWSF